MNASCRQLLLNGYRMLEKAEIKSAALDAELILAYVTKKNRAFLIAHPQDEVGGKQADKYYKLVAKRASHIPLAYLCGKKYFYSLDFKINHHVLVPRPETELMVDTVLEYIKKIGSTPTNIVDLGTGSGAIIISLAHSLKNRPKIAFYATDISKRALNLAGQNAADHNLEKAIIFLSGDLLKPFYTRLHSHPDHKLIICANLPYLSPIQISSSPSIGHEPRLALEAGADGLKYYRRLIRYIKNKFQNFDISLFCEIDPSQKTSFKALIKKSGLPATLGLIKDLKGHNRLALVEIRPPSANTRL